MPVFKTKDLLQKKPDTLPLLQVQKDAQIAAAIAKNLNKKHSSAVDTGQDVTDIDIEELFVYFKKANRKKIEKAFDKVKFEQLLLTTNDKTGNLEEELPFEYTKRDLKLHQDKLKAKVYTYMQKFFDCENEKFGVTRIEALSRTKLMIRKETEHISGLTSKLNGYLKDLDMAFAVFEGQESLNEVQTADEQRQKETELILLRAKVNNQVLIKNYNLGTFLNDIDTTL